MVHSYSMRTVIIFIILATFRLCSSQRVKFARDVVAPGFLPPDASPPSASARETTTVDASQSSAQSTTDSGTYGVVPYAPAPGVLPPAPLASSDGSYNSNYGAPSVSTESTLVPPPTAQTASAAPAFSASTKETTASYASPTTDSTDSTAGKAPGVSAPGVLPPDVSLPADNGYPTNPPSGPSYPSSTGIIYAPAALPPGVVLPPEAVGGIFSPTGYGNGRPSQTADISTSASIKPITNGVYAPGVLPPDVSTPGEYDLNGSEYPPGTGTASSSFSGSTATFSSTDYLNVKAPTALPPGVSPPVDNGVTDTSDTETTIPGLPPNGYRATPSATRKSPNLFATTRPSTVPASQPAPGLAPSGTRRLPDVPKAAKYRTFSTFSSSRSKASPQDLIIFKKGASSRVSASGLGDILVTNKPTISTFNHTRRHFPGPTHFLDVTSQPSSSPKPFQPSLVKKTAVSLGKVDQSNPTKKTLSAGSAKTQRTRLQSTQTQLERPKIKQGSTRIALQPPATTKAGPAVTRTVTPSIKKTVLSASSSAFKKTFADISAPGALPPSISPPGTPSNLGSSRPNIPATQPSVYQGPATPSYPGLSNAQNTRTYSPGTVPAAPAYLSPAVPLPAGPRPSGGDAYSNAKPSGYGTPAVDHSAYGPSIDPNCVDVHPKCEYFVANGKCLNPHFSAFVRQACPRSCSACEGGDSGGYGNPGGGSQGGIIGGYGTGGKPGLAPNDYYFGPPTVGQGSPIGSPGCCGGKSGGGYGPGTGTGGYDGGYIPGAAVFAGKPALPGLGQGDGSYGAAGASYGVVPGTSGPSGSSYQGGIQPSYSGGPVGPGAGCGSAGCGTPSGSYDKPAAQPSYGPTGTGTGCGSAGCPTGDSYSGNGQLASYGANPGGPYGTTQGGTVIKPQWTEWSSWNAVCSNGGKQYRSRTCDYGQNLGAAGCRGNSFDSRPCQTNGACCTGVSYGGGVAGFKQRRRRHTFNLQRKLKKLLIEESLLN